MNFTAAELRVLHHAVKVTYEEPRSELLEKLDAALSVLEPGTWTKVFELEFAIGATVIKLRRQRRAGQEVADPPRLWAPTMNEYNGLESYQKAKLRKITDDAILRARSRFPRWHCGVTERGTISRGKPVRHRDGGRRRMVIVLRESNRPPDEESTDAIGGKIPIDRMVAAGIFRDDSRDWLLRYSKWSRVPAGDGRVLVTVFEIGEAAVSAP